MSAMLRPVLVLFVLLTVLTGVMFEFEAGVAVLPLYEYSEGWSIRNLP